MLGVFVLHQVGVQLVEEPANHVFGQTAHNTGVLEGTPGGEHEEPADKLHLQGLRVSAPLSFSLLVCAKALCVAEEVKVQLEQAPRDTHHLAEELVVIRLVWRLKVEPHGGSGCVMLPCLRPLVVSAVQDVETGLRMPPTPPPLEGRLRVLLLGSA